MCGSSHCGRCYQAAAHCSFRLHCEQNTLSLSREWTGGTATGQTSRDAVRGRRSTTSRFSGQGTIPHHVWRIARNGWQITGNGQVTQNWEKETLNFKLERVWLFGRKCTHSQQPTHPADLQINIYTNTFISTPIHILYKYMRNVWFLQFLDGDRRRDRGGDWLTFLDFHVPCSTSLWKPRLSLIFVYAHLFLGRCRIVTGVTRSFKAWFFFCFPPFFSKRLSAAAWSIAALFPQRGAWHAGCQILKSREDAVSLCLRATATVCLRWYMFHAVYSINIFFLI